MKEILNRIFGFKRSGKNKNNAITESEKGAFLMGFEFQKFSKIQSYFGVHLGQVVDFDVNIFNRVFELLLSKTNIPNSHYGYIQQKLDFKESFFTNQEFLDAIKNDLSLYVFENGTHAKVYFLDKYLRVLSVIITYSDLKDTDVLKQINNLLSPLGDFYKIHQTVLGES
jgi:hypothetical protein